MVVTIENLEKMKFINLEIIVKILIKFKNLLVNKFWSFIKLFKNLYNLKRKLSINTLV